MTNDQIIAELRRSAVEDADPWACVRGAAFDAAYKLREDREEIRLLSFGDCRTFFLLVAEALESSNAR